MRCYMVTPIGACVCYVPAVFASEEACETLVTPIEACVCYVPAVFGSEEACETWGLDVAAWKCSEHRPLKGTADFPGPAQAHNTAGQTNANKPS